MSDDAGDAAEREAPGPVSDPALTTCAHCRRPIDPDDASIVLMRAGAPVAAYHETCRPDRRKSGCAGC